MNLAIISTATTRVVLIAVGLAASVVSARCLGPSARGNYAVMVVFAALIVQFGNIGFSNSSTLQLAANYSLLPRLLANSLWISIAWGGLLAIVSVILVRATGIWPHASALHLWLGALLAVPLMFNLLGGNLLISIERVGVYNALQVTGGALQLAGMLIAYAYNFGLTAFIVATIVGWTVTALGTLLALVRQARPTWRFEPSLFSSGLRYSIKSYLVCLLSYLIVKMNILAIDQFCDSEQTGYYAVASQGADILMILPASVSTVLFPRLVRNPHQQRKMITRTVKVMAVSMAGLCSLAALLIHPAIRLVFGEPYAPSARILLWMLPGVFVNSLVVVISQLLAARGNPRSLVYAWGAGVFASLAGLVIFVPAYGAIGASLVFSLTSILVLLLEAMLLQFTRVPRREFSAQSCVYNAAA